MARGVLGQDRRHRRAAKNMFELGLRNDEGGHEDTFAAFRVLRAFPVNLRFQLRRIARAGWL
jgi:hypothetical protein